jgi:hypothetical protein
MWNSTEQTQLKAGTLNTSDYIHVTGWTPYNPRQPFKFFSRIGLRGFRLIKKLTPIKNVLHGSDAPTFGLDDPSLNLAFGNPSTAKIYEVPQGKNFVLLRFQSEVDGAPFLGRWSVLLDIVDAEDISDELDAYAEKFAFLRYKYDLTTLDVTRALNILPAFTESSVFWSLLSETDPLPAVGEERPVIDSAFIERLKPGQQVLAGKIFKGQQDIIQVKDVLPGASRTQCPL